MILRIGLCLAVVAAGLPAFAQSPYGGERGRPPRVIIINNEPDDPPPVKPAARPIQRVEPATPLKDEPPVKADSSPIQRIAIPAGPKDDSPAVRTKPVVVIPAAESSEKPAEDNPPAVAEALAGASLFGGTGVCPPPRIWAAFDYLSWRVENGPLKLPLVTTGDPTTDPLAGTVGRAGTRALFGGTDLDYGQTSGYRFTVGGWLDHDIVGVEGSAFFLETREVPFAAQSNGAGAPALFLPIINVATGREGRVIVADPVAGFAGNVSVDNKSRLWGWDANALLAVTRGRVELTLLGGFRYASLSESLALTNNSTDLALGTQTSIVDQFQTSNHFYGGQVGGRVTCDCGKFFFGLTYKIAVGCATESVDVSGVTRQSAVAPLPSGTFPGGVFAQSSNIGRHSSTEFAAIPELNLRVGCQLLNCLRAYVGYDVLYWSQVARPGIEVDRALNPTQSPIFGTGSLAGAARPAGLFNRTDFYAQGFTAGLEFRY